MKDARFLSILLATTTLVCAALGADYLYRLDRPSGRTPHHLPPAQPALIEKPAPTAQTAPRTEAEVEQHGLMRKCMTADGKISYSDKPCAAGEQARLIAKDSGSAGLRPQRSYQQQLAEETARQNPAEPERQTPAEPERQTPATRRIIYSKEISSAECAQLDREIAALDADLRQAHGPQLGDYWTAQRKRATDRRYVLQCGR